VRDLLGTVAVAAGVFFGTDVDDLIVLTVLFLSARASGRPTPGQIWAGQYAGIGALVAISALAALGLTVVPDQWVGLVGLVPLALGVFGLIQAIRGRDDAAPVVAGGVASVMGITIANGADNISVYTPLFRTIGVAESVVTVVVFAIGVALWCLAGSWLGSHPAVVAVMKRYGHWIVPTVFVLIGAVILIETGVIPRLAGSL
jgi:cadmium resistance protein CadD (predicted permease)